MDGRPHRPGAARGVQMGSESALYYFSDPQFQPALYAQYGLTEPENECKPDWITPVRGEFDTSNCSYTIAQMRGRGGGQARACCVVWGAMAQPPWLAHGSWNASTLAPVMAELMTGIMGAPGIRGNVLAWDVVNEPICDKCPADNSTIFKGNTWFPTLGNGYVEAALRLARAADPNALLFARTQNFLPLHLRRRSPLILSLYFSTPAGERLRSGGHGRQV